MDKHCSDRPQWIPSTCTLTPPLLNSAKGDQEGEGNARVGDPGEAEGFPKGAQRGTPFQKCTQGGA